MQSQSIIRVQKNPDNPFVMIDKRIFSDDRLSWKAKGILGYLLSKPDNWKVIITDLTKQSKDGEKAVYSGLKELVENGYLVRQPSRDAKGKITKWEYIIFETPQNSDDKEEPTEEEPANPCAASSCLFPTSSFSTCGKGRTTNNDITKNDLNKNDLKDQGQGICSANSCVSFDEYLKNYPVDDEDRIEAVNYYLDMYEKYRHEKHPAYKPKQWEKILDEIFTCSDEERSFDLSLEDIRLMIDQHFRTHYQESCNYQLLHFVQNGVLVRRMYEVAY